MNDRLKIFVSAYACEPAAGSEIGVGWHWVLEMSKRFELWVLTRESNRRNIEPWISEHPEYGNIHWLYFDLPRWARFWKKGLRGVRTYYNIWQFCTDRIVRRTMREHGIEVFHHLTYGNALWRVSRYGRRKFFIWGPVGGLETIPEEYSRHYGLKSQIIETVRRAMARAARLNLGLRSRCRHADLILCKTDITRRALPLAAQGKAILFTDVAAEPVAANDSAPDDRCESNATEFVTVGRLDAWRGFDLALEALAEASKSGANQLRLTIVGDGTDRPRLETLAERLGVSGIVTFAGKVPMDEYRRLMEGADVVVNAALKEGAVTVSFDAMAMGKPLICLDTTGYTRYFSSQYAIVVPRTGREEVISRLKDAMLRLTDRSERQQMGLCARRAAENLCWQRHGEEIHAAIVGACGQRSTLATTSIDAILQHIIAEGGGAPYYRLANAEGKAWLMPARQLQVGMELYQPSGRKGKLLKRLFPLLHRSTLVRRVLQAESLRCELREEVRGHLVKIFGSRPLCFSIFCGTPCVHRKITMQISAGNDILGYAKFTDVGHIASLFQREKDLLGELWQKGLRDIPQPLFCGQLESGITMFVQSTAKTLRAKTLHRWTPIHDDFLARLYACTRQRLPFEQTDYCRMLQQLSAHFDWLPDADAQQAARWAYGYLMQKWAGRTVDVAACHADFTPWNTFLAGKRLYAFDWEYAERTYPPRLDRYHFFTQTAIFEKHWGAEEIKRYIHSEEGAWIDADTYIAYLLDAAARFTLREQRRVSGEAARPIRLWLDVLASLTPSPLPFVHS